MKRLLEWILIFVFIISTCIFSVSGQSARAAAGKKIVKIDALNYSITQNDRFILPSTVKAVLSNNSSVNMKVVWKVKKVDTSKKGTFIFKGSVAGYPKEVSLRLVIRESLVEKKNSNGSKNNVGNTSASAIITDKSSNANDGKSKNETDAKKESAGVEQKEGNDTKNSVENTSVAAITTDKSSNVNDGKADTKKDGEGSPSKKEDNSKPVEEKGTIHSQSFDVIKELCSDKYQGKAAGSDGYERAVKFFAGELQNAGVVSFFKNDNYFQKFTTKTGNLISESFKINGQRYEIMKDYMPASTCASGSFNSSKIIYVGEGKEKDYSIDVAGSVVIFKWSNSGGTFGGGIMDRILIAKAHGAKAVLIVTNGELKIGNYEHPINGDDIGMPCLYISEAVAQNIFGIPNNDDPRQLNEKQIEIDLNIKRGTAESENVIGVIPGKCEDKAILVTTNIDGFGKLPDGRVYENASASVAAPVMLLDLAKYYKKYKPEYTIIIAIVGSKWTDKAGINELTNLIDFNKIVTTLDLYAMGGTGNPYNSYIDKSFEAFSTKILHNPIYNDDLGNSASAVLKQKTAKVILIRDSDTWFDQSFSDTLSKIDLSNYESGLRYLDNLINNIIKCSQEELSAVKVDYDKVNTEYNDEIKKTLTYKESKYFKVYYDESYSPYINRSFLEDIDVIYERISKFNYYPNVMGKVKLLYFNNRNDAAILAGRKDFIGRVEASGGGFASIDPTRPVINGSEVALGNISHELNHLLVNCKHYGASDPNLQECQGQSFLVYYSGRDYITDPGTLITSYLNSFEAPKVIENAVNYRKTLDWKIFTENKTDPDGWQNSYHTLGSMYSYIYYNYGGNTARRAIYRIYENKSQLNKELISELGLTEEEFLDSWSKWMGSHGNEVGDRVKTLIKDYNDLLTGYDYEKIYTDVDSVNNVSGSTNNGVSQKVELPSIVSSQVDVIGYGDDGNSYAEIQYSKDISSTNVKVLSAGLAKDSENVYLKLKFNILQSIKPHVFLQGDAKGLSVDANELNPGDNTIIIRFNKNEALNYSAGVAVYLGNRDFVFIDKQLMDYAVKQ